MKKRKPNAGDGWKGSRTENSPKKQGQENVKNLNSTQPRRTKEGGGKRWKVVKKVGSEGGGDGWGGGRFVKTPLAFKEYFSAGPGDMLQKRKCGSK